MDISIHALLAESDNRRPIFFYDEIEFLSTLSLRRATTALYNIFKLLTISIHALLAESDNTSFIICVYHTTISIHALLAESDQFPDVCLCRLSLFLSTLSLRRATISRCLPVSAFTISIHALLAESDE